MRFRRAVEDDLAEISVLLAEADLPSLETGQPLSNLVVALDDSQVVACVDLEIYGRSGLVRSMVVAADRRTNGIGRELFRSLLARAYELGLKELFLLAADAEGFFTKLGFAAVPRERAPGQIRDSKEVQGFYPETATLMRLALA